MSRKVVATGSASDASMFCASLSGGPLSSTAPGGTAITGAAAGARGGGQRAFRDGLERHRGLFGEQCLVHRLGGNGDVGRRDRLDPRETPPIGRVER